MRASRFYAELRRRNVIRAAALYAAIAWLLVQVATQVFPFFHIDERVVRWIVVAAAIGFVPFLLFSWFYEITPEGLKRESEIAPEESTVRQTSRRIDRAIIVTLGLAVVLLIADRFVAGGSDQSPSMSTAPASAATAAIMPSAPISDKSIAVLPFENMSADKDNAYFADGIQDEILTRLAKIGALKVISRTSTLQYAAKPGNVPEIAQRLGVAHILEGSVQRVGNAVRVTVQLIKAASDEHLWAETYDRKLDDVFGVESEVAQAVASELQVKLTGGEKVTLAARPTSNPGAYEAYLRARAINSQDIIFKPDDLRRLSAYYAEAVRLDPNFALAWAYLAMVEAHLKFQGVDRDRDEDTLARSKQAIDTALGLQPELGEVFLAKGYYHYWGLRDYAGALAELEQARLRLPNNAEVFHAMGLIERRQGRWRESIAHLAEAARLDPQSVPALATLADAYVKVNEFANARAIYDRLLQVQPAESKWHLAKADSYQDEGDLDAAARELEGIPLYMADSTAQPDQLFQKRRYPELIEMLEKVLADPKAYGADDDMRVYLQTYLADVYRLMGSDDKAKSLDAQALRELDALRRSDANDAVLWGLYARAHAGAGDSEKAIAYARRGVESAANDAYTRPSAERTLVLIQAKTGDIDGAIVSLQNQAQEPTHASPGSLMFNPNWDPLRKDPRFEAIVAASKAADASRTSAR